MPLELNHRNKLCLVFVVKIPILIVIVQRNIHLACHAAICSAKKTKKMLRRVQISHKRNSRDRKKGRFCCCWLLSLSICSQNGVQRALREFSYDKHEHTHINHKSQNNRRRRQQNKDVVAYSHINIVCSESLRILSHFIPCVA